MATTTHVAVASGTDSVTSASIAPGSAPNVRVAPAQPAARRPSQRHAAPGRKGQRQHAPVSGQRPASVTASRRVAHRAGVPVGHQAVQRAAVVGSGPHMGSRGDGDQIAKSASDAAAGRRLASHRLQAAADQVAPVAGSRYGRHLGAAAGAGRRTPLAPMSASVRPH